MKLIKSLLLGSAAGVMAVAGAQAADLPVKAKPVEYVKICSLYGDGFFYVPGTDICLRFGANVQADHYWNALGNGHTEYDQAAGARDRGTSAFSSKARGDFAVDSRTQTQYGTLRSYLVYRIDNVDQGTVTPNLVRNFVQWAGFTFGHTRSYADPIGTFNEFKAIFQEGALFGSTSANGTNQIAYTWELGNGMVIVTGADERKNSPIVNLSTAGVVTLGGTPTTSRGGQNFWDPYVAFRVSQAWGGFTAALHSNYNGATYYTGNTPGNTNCVIQPGLAQCDHPTDKWGWAFATGLEIKTPWISQGDRVGASFGYGVGASRYVMANTVAAGLFKGNQVAVGVGSDAVFVTGSQLELTTTWAVTAEFEHWWTPELSSIIYGGTGEHQYNNTVVGNRWFCGGGGAAAQSFTVSGATACDPGFKFTQVGTQLDWYPMRGWHFGVGLLYTMIDSAFDGTVVTLGKAQGLRPTGRYLASNQNILAANFRVQRNFGGLGGD